MNHNEVLLADHMGVVALSIINLLSSMLTAPLTLDFVQFLAILILLYF